MADFFAENWGNLASVFGLVFSFLAFRQERVNGR